MAKYKVTFHSGNSEIVEAKNRDKAKRQVARFLTGRYYGQIKDALASIKSCKLLRGDRYETT